MWFLEQKAYGDQRAEVTRSEVAKRGLIKQILQADLREAVKPSQKMEKLFKSSADTALGTNEKIKKTRKRR
jgi:hypothetical protein